MKSEPFLAIPVMIPEEVVTSSKMSRLHSPSDNYTLTNIKQLYQVQNLSHRPGHRSIAENCKI